MLKHKALVQGVAQACIYKWTVCGRMGRCGRVRLHAVLLEAAVARTSAPTMGCMWL